MCLIDTVIDNPSVCLVVFLYYVTTLGHYHCGPHSFFKPYLALFSTTLLEERKVSPSTHLRLSARIP